LIEVLLFVAWLVTVMYVTNGAFPVDEHGDRHGFNVIQLADFLA
jgi:hypothetical protein